MSSHYATLFTSNEYRFLLLFFSYDMARKRALDVSDSIAETAVETALLYEAEGARMNLDIVLSMWTAP